MQLTDITYKAGIAVLCGMLVFAFYLVLPEMFSRQGPMCHGTKGVNQLFGSCDQPKQSQVAKGALFPDFDRLQAEH